MRKVRFKESKKEFEPTLKPKPDKSELVNWKKIGEDEWENSIGMCFIKIPNKKNLLGKFPVTQKEWTTIMGTTPWKGKPFSREGNDYPATYISWNDCQQFIKKINELEGSTKYRFPNEFEWEYACCAGTKTEYSFGNDSSKLGEYAWYGGLKGNGNCTKNRHPHKVGYKKPNKWGFHDMHGNVWEWTMSKHGSRRIYRGGSWDLPAVSCISTSRGSMKPVMRKHFIGMRLLRLE